MVFNDSSGIRNFLFRIDDPAPSKRESERSLLAGRIAEETDQLFLTLEAFYGLAVHIQQLVSYAESRIAEVGGRIRKETAQSSSAQVAVVVLVPQIEAEETLGIRLQSHLVHSIYRKWSRIP